MARRAPHPRQCHTGSAPRAPELQIGIDCRGCHGVQIQIGGKRVDDGLDHLDDIVDGGCVARFAEELFQPVQPGLEFGVDSGQ
jgi:hypothetical protein